MKDYFFGIAILVGTIIGVGMFSLPLVTYKAGVTAFLFFIILFGFLQHYVHLLFAEITLRTKQVHRLPGYAGIYLGKRSEVFVGVVSLLAGYGALLAYIIIGGIFLHDLLNPYFGGGFFIYSLILFLIQAVAVLIGLSIVASLELFLSLILLLVVILISFKGWQFIKADNFHLIDFSYSFLPYGAVLFAVSGSSAIPILRKLFVGKEEKLKTIIRFGTFIPVIVMIIFTLVVVGISGSATTSDTLTGLRYTLSDGIIFFALIFGILTIATSFLVVAEAVREIFYWDFKFKSFFSWIIAVWPPFILFVLGWQDLIKVVSLSGGILGSLIVVSILRINFAAKKKRTIKPQFSVALPSWLFYVLSFVFIIGAILSLITGVFVI